MAKKRSSVVWNGHVETPPTQIVRTEQQATATGGTAYRSVGGTANRQPIVPSSAKPNAFSVPWRVIIREMLKPSKLMPVNAPIP